MSKQPLVAALLLTLCLPACGPASREDWRNEAARASCNRQDDCGNIGPGKDFRDYDDCEVNQRNRFNQLWPADACSGDRINEARAEACISRIENASCNSGLFDGLAFASECNAGKVCID